MSWVEVGKGRSRRSDHDKGRSEDGKERVAPGKEQLIQETSDGKSYPWKGFCL